MDPLINILTRTSGRPNSFKRCVESVLNQDYHNIKHIIITDDESNFEYIHKFYNDGVYLVDRDELISNDNSIDPKTGQYSPHNLYFNDLKGDIKDGWVMYLDDDDYLLDGAIDEIVKNIKSVDEDTILYWKMLYSNGKSIPKIINDNKPPIRGQIGSPCFTYNSKYHKTVNWDGWKCSDFRVVKKLHNLIPKYKWVDKNLVMIPIAGFGNRKDVK